ncbi:MAG: DNA/RNA non-specific endonuclease [Lentimicrobiaceae bacterium]|nr:DNA/RNA non-specific endonuclease [Lentimicrobiaceae bacterium]
MYQKFTTTKTAADSSSKNFLTFFCAIVALSLISCVPAEVIVTEIKPISQNEDFQGVHYHWNSEINDSCFLKVANFVFDDYENFTLTLKRHDQTEDFVISLQDDQQMMAEPFYKFQIPYTIGKTDLDSLYISNFKKLTPVFVPVNNLEIPYTNEPEHIVSHIGFSLFFNDAHKQADWVAYMLCKERRIKDMKDDGNRPNFKVDPTVKNGSTVKHEDYTNSKYSRGHLCANEDMSWLREARLETFYCSNISPQKQNFNDGIWKKLETLVRKWAEVYDTLYVVTGPVLRNELPSIRDLLTEKENEGYKSKTRISVPEYFYKVILVYNSSSEVKGIGFIMPHEDFRNPAPLQNYAVTIDSVQKLTGINFYDNLPNKRYEKKIETTICEDCWVWK